jgi:hypothetical protein
VRAAVPQHLQIDLVARLDVAQQLNHARHGLWAVHIRPVHGHDEIAGTDARLLRRASRTDFAHTRPRSTARIIELNADQDACRTSKRLDALHHRPIYLRGERCELLRRHLEAAARRVHLRAQRVFPLSGRGPAAARFGRTGAHDSCIDLRRV